LTVNGQSYQVACDVRATLLDTLRDHLGLTGTKKGCDQGGCGAWLVRQSRDLGAGERYADLLARHGLDELTAEAEATPPNRRTSRRHRRSRRSSPRSASTQPSASSASPASRPSSTPAASAQEDARARGGQRG
jgi:hypothetical protein